MSLSFGLNVKPKPGRPPATATPSKKPSIFDDSDSDPDDAPAPTSNVEAITTLDFSSSRSTKPSAPRPKTKPSKPLPPSGPPKPRALAPDSFSDLSSTRHSAQHETDATINDYDSFHASLSAARSLRTAEAKQDAVERKPKYIANLLSAAAQRKQDALVAREKVLLREREAEGDAFADKEAFVTGAYKAAQEAARAEEAKEAARKEEEEARRKKMGGGMAGFYRGVLGDGERLRDAEVRAAEKIEAEGGPAEGQGDTTVSDRDLVAEMRRKGVEVSVNDEGAITDKRQLLSAGLNVAPNPGTAGGGRGGAEHLRSRADRPNAFREAQKSSSGARDAQRERHTRQMEAQLEAAAKRKADDEDAERARLERAAKSRKTDEEKSGARERFLARKREREEEAARRREKEGGGGG